MAYAVLTEVPWVDYSYSDHLPVEEVMERGPFYSDRYQLADVSRRVYTLPFKRTTSERATFDAFFKTGGSGIYLGLNAFLFADPKDSERTAVSLGNGTGAQTVFPLPSTGEERRHYPKQGTVVARVSGVPVAVASVDTDARTVTLAAPPGLGAPVEVDFTGLRLVRLVEPYEWHGLDASWWETVLSVEECLTD